MAVDLSKLVDLERLKEEQGIEHGMIATVESNSTASKAYEIGDRFYFKGKLCICTVPITSGGTITLNTNCKLDVLGDDVSELKTAVTQLEDVVVVSDTEPTSDTNKIWVDSNADSVQIPTIEDLQSILPQITLEDESVLHFTDGANNIPLVNLTGDVDYNANGISKITLYHSGKNTVMGSIKDTSIGTTGVIGSSPGYTMFYGTVKEGETYTVTSGDTQLVGGFYVDKPEYNSTASYNDSRIVQPSKTITAPITGYFAFRDSNSSTVNSQLEEGSVASSYANPYSKEYEITLTDTIYGGEIDVVNGVVKSTLAADGTALAEPVEYEVPHLNIRTQKGENNIWSDCGNMSCVYCADIKTYIDNAVS